MKIAIIGTGISGLTAAHYLHSGHELTLFEANAYIGGHTNTILVDTEDGPLSVDTGFIVFNHRTYPNFIQLLQQLDVASQPTSMTLAPYGIVRSSAWAYSPRIAFSTSDWIESWSL